MSVCRHHALRLCHVTLGGHLGVTHFILQWVGGCGSAAKSHVLSHKAHASSSQGMVPGVPTVGPELFLEG